jgi:hypothetical protein
VTGSSPYYQPSQQPTTLSGLIKNSFTQAKAALAAYLKNPKQLIPVIILAVFWIGLGVLQALGIKPWPLKFLSFLTFAQGGLFGGFWGAVGGIVGKAIFAYFVSALLVPVFTGKASKKAISEGFRRFTSGFKQFSLGIAAALLMGIGAALIVYNFLSGNSTLINSMPGLVGFVLALRTLIRQTGFLWNLLLMIAGKLSKGRLPATVTVHRFFSGFAAGGLAGVGLSALPWAYLPYLVGLVLVVVGIVLGVVSKSQKSMKQTVSLLLIIMLLFTGITGSIFDDYTVSAEGEGVWEYVGVDYIDPPEGNYQTTSISDGYASQRVVSPESGDVYEASARWTAPGTSYEAGQIVKITISVQIDNYVWNGEDDGYIHMGLNYMSTMIAARIDITDIGYGGATRASIDLDDADGNYKCEVSTDNGKIVKQSESREVFAEFPAGRTDGEQISVHVHSQGGLARYNYVWHAAPVETTLPVETEPYETEPTTEWSDPYETDEDTQPVDPEDMEGEDGEDGGPYEHAGVLATILIALVSIISAIIGAALGAFAGIAGGAAGGMAAGLVPPEPDIPPEAYVPPEPEYRVIQSNARGSTIMIQRDPVTGEWINSETGNPFDLEAHERNEAEYIEKFNDYVEDNEELERTGQTAMQQALDAITQEQEEREAIIDWLRRMQNSAGDLGMGEKGEIDDMYGRLGQEIDRIAAGGEVDAERIIKIRDYIGKRASGEHVTPDDQPPEESTLDLWRQAAIETGRNLSQVTNEDGSTSWSGLVGRVAIAGLTGGSSEWVFVPMGSVYTMKDAIDRGESGLSAATAGVTDALVQYGVGKAFAGITSAAGGAAKGAFKGASTGGLKGAAKGGLKCGWNSLKSTGQQMSKEAQDLFSRKAWQATTTKLGQSLGRGISLSQSEKLKLNQFSDALKSGDPQKISKLYKNGGMKDLAKLQQKGVISAESAQKCNQALSSQVNDSIRKGTVDTIKSMNNSHKSLNLRVEDVIVGDSGSSARSAVTRLKTDFDRTLIPKFNQDGLKAYAKANNMSVSDAYDDLCKQFRTAHEANVDKALGQAGLDAKSVGYKSYDRIGSASGQADSYTEGFTNARQAAAGSGEVFKVKADGTVRNYKVSGQTVVDQNRLNNAMYKSTDILDDTTKISPKEVPSIVKQQVSSLSSSPNDPLTVAKALGRTEKGAKLLGGSLKDPKLTQAASEIYEDPGRTAAVLKKYGFTDQAGNADPSKFCQAGKDAVTNFDKTLKP